MYVRKKPNRSGSTSVVVVEKKAGKVCYLKTIGVSSVQQEIDELYRIGKKWVAEQLGLRDMFMEYAKAKESKEVVEALLNNIEQVLINGKQLILNSVFKAVGF